MNEYNESKSKKIAVGGGWGEEGDKKNKKDSLVWIKFEIDEKQKRERPDIETKMN